VAELSADARIRDLERRLDLDPASRLFVSLAEEYRKVGRFKQALSAIQKGLLAHPGYIAAQVALGRVYVEVGQSTDAIATFTKVLVADPGNLVASKSLADIYLGRGDKLEALKKYKLYRALSGDRKVDAVIVGLESEVAPRPVTPARSAPKVVEPPPPPPKFQETDKSRRRPSVRALPQEPLPDAFEITSVAFEPGEDSGSSKADDPFPFIPTRDTAIAAPEQRMAAAPEPAVASPAASAPAAFTMDAPTAPLTLVAPIPPPPLAAIPPLPPPVVETAPPPPIVAAASQSAPAPFEIAEPAPAPAASAESAPAPLFQPSPDDAIFGEAPALFQNPEEPAAEEVPVQAAATESAAATPPTGRALADLYYSQGHYAEALQIYDDLVTRHPFDEELMKMRRDAEARLLPAGQAPSAGGADPGVERRRARIRALERWLSRVQAG
jgi:tetratricopeptide (TPR) repeat protein